MDRLRKLGNTDIEVAAIAYGCMGQTHSYGKVQEKNDMVELLRYAYETGYTMFDTAPAYGDLNEQFLGEAVKPFRNRIVIATKFGILHMQDSGAGVELSSGHDSIMKQVDESLTRLGTDYIDLYYQHRPDPEVEPEEVAETMKELFKAGKIRAWGVSFGEPDYLKRAHKVFPLAAIENMYNFVDRGDEAVYFPLCEELGLSYVSACPLAKGLLSGRLNKNSTYREGDWRGRMALFNEESMDKNAPLLELLSELAEKKHATPAQISLAWEITKKPYIIPIPGTTKKERVRENIGGLGVELTGQDMLDIEEALGHMDIIGMHY